MIPEARRRGYARAAWLVLLAGGGCCREYAALGAQQVCLVGDAGVAAGRSFAVDVTVYDSVEAGRCTVVRDGGALAFTVAGTACKGVGTQPVVPMATVRCEVPGLEAGRYVVVTGSQTQSLDVGAAGADAGLLVPRCD